MLLAIAFGLGVVLAWPAFFMALGARREARALALEVSSLRRRIEEAGAPAPTQAPSAPPIADPPTPEPSEDASSLATVPAPPPWGKRPTRETPAPGSSAAPSSKIKGGSAGGALERGLAGNWLLWVGGAALVLGGGFLVKSAIDAGFFGPVFRIAAGLAAGAAMIGAAQWLKRRIAEESLAPSVLAGAGGATIYGAIYAAYGLYGLIPAAAAFAALALASAGAVILAVIHRRPAMAGLALAGAHVSPLITSEGAAAPIAFYLYLLGVTGAALVVARLMRWRTLAWCAIVGALFWPALDLIALSGSEARALAVYLPALIALAASIAWSDADAALDGAAIIRLRLKGLPLSLGAFYLAAAGALFLLVRIADAGATATPAFAALGALAILASGFAHRRQGFAVFPLMTAVAAAAALYLAPDADSAMKRMIALGFGAAFSAIGAALSRIHVEKGPFAALAAFAPTAMLASLAADGGASPSILWGALALIVAFLNAFALIAYDRAGALDRHPGAASSHALGAVAASALAIAIVADGLAMSALLALHAPVIAFVWRRFPLPALAAGALILGATASIRLLFLPDALDASLGAAPLFNALILTYLLPAAGFWIAARWFDAGLARKNAMVVQTMEGAAITLAAAFISLEIRHALHQGDLRADYDSLIEISLQTISWAGVAAFLRWRFGGALTPVRVVLERLLLLLAALQTLVAPLLLFNPWWGEDRPAIAGPPVFNLLLLYFLAPAAAFAAAAFAARRHGAHLQSRIAGVAAGVLGYVFLLLTVRQIFHAPDLGAGAIEDRESWGYSIVTILFASLVLVVGAIRKSALLRMIGFAALLLVIGKVFVLDMADLDGIWRASAFLGLGAALIAIAALYQRLSAARASVRSETPSRD